MTSKELERYHELIDKARLHPPLTKKEEKEINKLGNKSVAARKRDNKNREL